MRPIEFRAWDNKTNVMLYDGFVVRSGNDNHGAEILEQPVTEVQMCLKAHQDKTGLYSLIDWSNYYGLEHLRLMQFTGRLDKNGTKIFEPDIVKAPWLGLIENLPGTAIIEWHDAGFCFKWMNGKYNIFPHIEHPYVEVIGNIYQNPELLNKIVE